MRTKRKHTAARLTTSSAEVNHLLGILARVARRIAANGSDKKERAA
ncbi:MAG: hypothetical protein HDKAJFGB_01832 [Anaerolineae bacterium]|nr:hypothetical protein [Anaerolineae bacterium]